MTIAEKFPHYHKDVRHLKSIDVYRLLELFGVTDQAIGHAIKKLMVAGGRGAKDVAQDIQEAIDTLQRWQEMRIEDTTVDPLATAQSRIFDLLLGDDGQAWKEAERYIERERPDLHKHLQRHKDEHCTVGRDRFQP